ncbi:MAG: hypothetical protein ABR509_00850 [Candidatus Limnocylindria bacterium]
MTYSLDYDPNPGARAAIEQARILVGRAPYLSTRGRREATRALDALDKQLSINRISPRSSALAIELLNRAHPSIAFGLLRNEGFSSVFAPALRELGLRGIRHRLDEVDAGQMASPIPGPIGGRRHRDELPPEQRLDADGRPLPPPPGYY